MGFSQDRIVAKDETVITFTFYAHASVGIEWNGIQIYVDPAGEYNHIDFSKEPKADIILVTHHHKDHLDKESICQLLKEKGIVVASAECKIGITAIPKEVIDVLGISIDIVPAYNITREHLQYHPKERKDCGYVLNLGGTRIYIAGDTEDNEDVLALRDIDIAFLPMNQPYTMNLSQFINCVMAICSNIIFVYHTNGLTEINKLSEEIIRKFNIKYGSFRNNL